MKVHVRGRARDPFHPPREDEREVSIDRSITESDDSVKVAVK